jgi:hypothetical protein
VRVEGVQTGEAGLEESMGVHGEKVWSRCAVDDEGKAGHASGPDP